MNTPSFYCENCGRKVSRGKDICPGCGQEFSLVKCPSCSFAGEASLFKGECPQCGYKGADTEETPVNINIPGVLSTKKGKQLPVWLDRILIVILIITVAGLIRLYFLL